jgi:hypothetical protein
MDVLRKLARVISSQCVALRHGGTASGDLR